MVLGLAACAAPPAAPVGPVLPEGLDHGRIADGVYHDKRDWYSVSVPFHPDEPGFATLSVSEAYPAGVSYVAFIPNYTGGEYYRVYIEDFYATNQPVPALPKAADMAMDFFGKQLVQQRLERLKLVEEKPWTAGDSSGYLRLYTEKVPIELILQNLGMAEDYTAYMLIYVTARNGKVAVVWTEWPVGCAPCRPVPAGPPAKSGNPIEQAVAQNARALQFITSFRYGPG